MPKKTRQFGCSNIAPGPDEKRPAVNRHTTSQQCRKSLSSESSSAFIRGIPDLSGEIPAHISLGILTCGFLLRKSSFVEKYRRWR